MRLKLIASTPGVETLVATAILTTSSGKTPQEIYGELRGDKVRVEKIVKRIILKHGSVLEHNRLVFLAEAEENEILSLLLANRFLEATRLGRGRWLLSCNLRTLLSLLKEGEGLPEGLREGLEEALREVAPSLWRRVRDAGGAR